MSARTFTLLALTLTGAVLTAAPAFAGAPHDGSAHGAVQPTHMHGPGMRGGPGMYGDPEMMLERMATVLDLSKEQRDALRAIADKRRNEFRALRDRLQDNRKQMAELNAAGPADPASVRPLADAHGKAVADLMVLQAEMRAEMSGVLTDAQRAKLRELREQRRQRPGGPRSGDGPAQRSGLDERISVLVDAHRLARQEPALMSGTLL